MNFPDEIPQHEMRAWVREQQLAGDLTDADFIDGTGLTSTIVDIQTPIYKIRYERFLGDGQYTLISVERRGYEIDEEDGTT